MPGRHLWRVIGRSRGQWGHGGHWTIIFNGMDFWTKYCFFKDFTGLLIWTRDRWMISYLCDLADVILTSTLRKGNLLKFSTLPLTVFVSTWPSFTLRIHFTSTCKKERLCSIHFQGENSEGGIRGKVHVNIWSHLFYEIDHILFIMFEVGSSDWK